MEHDNLIIQNEEDLTDREQSLLNLGYTQNRLDFSDLFLRPSWIRDPISPLLHPVSEKLDNPGDDILPEL